MTQIQRSLLLMVPVATAYQVVADVQSYAEFLPGCDAVEVLELPQLTRAERNRRWKKSAELTKIPFGLFW